MPDDDQDPAAVSGEQAEDKARTLEEQVDAGLLYVLADPDDLDELGIWNALSSVVNTFEKDRKAIEQLQARLSMLTALVGEVANSLNGALVLLIESDWFGKNAPRLAQIASDLVVNMAATFRQMGVDPETLARATGIVLPAGEEGSDL